MGEVSQRAGGGKVTVEGLTAEVVRAGKPVTVRQGSKVVQSLVGTLPVAVFALYAMSYYMQVIQLPFAKEDVTLTQISSGTSHKVFRLTAAAAGMYRVTVSDYWYQGFDFAGTSGDHYFDAGDVIGDLRVNTSNAAWSMCILIERIGD